MARRGVIDKGRGCVIQTHGAELAAKQNGRKTGKLLIAGCRFERYVLLHMPRLTPLEHAPGLKKNHQDKAL